MRRLSVLIFSIFCIFAMNIQVFAQMYTVNPSEKIYDFAELLSPDEALQLAEMATEISNRQQMDIAIVTVLSTGNRNPEQYADDFYDQNGFGYGSGDDGLLLLIDMGQRQIHITTYNMGQTLFWDDDINNILDDIYQNLKDDDFYGGCLTFLNDSDEHITYAVERQKDLDKNPTNYNGNNNYQQSNSSSNGYTPLQIFGVSLLAGVVIAIITLAIMYFLHKASMSQIPSARQYLKQNGFNVNHSVDRFLTTHTSRTAIPQNNNSSGGSSGGSGHSSSSGRTHGGGGRSF